MTATREQSIEELREWISATIDELNRTLAALRSGADPVAIMPRLAAALSWSPVIDELVRLIEDPPVHEPARTQRARRVLIVDDSEGYRLLATRVLSVAGYEVKQAGDGSEAWAQLQQQPFDVVITDAEMPEMDGFELVQRVRASSALADLPVILLTGRDAPEDQRLGIAAGADLFLHKFRPDTVSTLLAHLARMTDREA
jgi:CheY-like chemotaxis protein